MARAALSAARAIDVLEFLAAHPHGAFTYSELSGRLDINLASLHAVLHELEQRRFLARDPETKRYTLGLALAATGDAALRRHRALDLVRREMAGLGRRLSLECVAFAAVRNEMLCLATAGTDRPTIQVGQRVPLLAPFGVVFVAWSAPAVVDAWLRRSGIDRARATHAAAALETVRERGFSATLDRPEYREIERLVVELGDRPHAPELWQALRGRIAGVDRAEFVPTRSGRRRQRVRDITAPVFDDAGRPAIALTVQGFDGPRRSSDIEEIAAALLEVTRRVGDESHV